MKSFFDRNFVIALHTYDKSSHRMFSHASECGQQHSNLLFHLILEKGILDLIIKRAAILINKQKVVENQCFIIGFCFIVLPRNGTSPKVKSGLVKTS